MGHREKLDTRSSSLEMRAKRWCVKRRTERAARKARSAARVEQSVDGRWSVHPIDPALFEMLPGLKAMLYSIYSLR